jgi:hypothetical protein
LIYYYPGERVRAGSGEKTPESGSSNRVFISGVKILPVPATTARIPSPDMITVVLLSPSYHFPELSRRFLPEIYGIIVLGTTPFNKLPREDRTYDLTAN